MKRVILGLVLFLFLVACGSATVTDNPDELDSSGALILGEIDHSGMLISVADKVNDTNRYVFDYCCASESGLIIFHSGVNLDMTVTQPSGASIVTDNLYTQPGPLPVGTWTIVVANVDKGAQSYILSVSLE